MLPLIAWRALEIMNRENVDEAWYGGEWFFRFECERTLGDGDDAEQSD